VTPRAATLDVVRIKAAEQPPDDPRLAEMAARQHGVVARAQLLALGFSSQAIKTLHARERLHRLHPSVYAVGHERLTAKGRWMAAVLACGPNAMLSHREAAALHDLRQIGSGPINVTSVRRHALAGVRSHRARTLDPADGTTVDAIPVTSLARTYLDLAELLSHTRLIDALEAGQRQDKLDIAAINATIDRNPGRHGIPALREAIAELADTPPLLQSDLERAFRALVRAHGLPMPQFNVYVEGELADVVFPDHRLVVEVDGWLYHRGRRAFNDDRRRDRKRVRAGWRVIRFSDDQVQYEPELVGAELSELLRDGPWLLPAR
jgi:very-short-patch-repair endonuclease